VRCFGVILNFSASAPDAEDQALTAVKQPETPTAVGANLFPRSMRSTSGNASTTAAGVRSPDAAAFSSDIPDAVRACQAVAVISSSALAATANRFSNIKNQTTLRVVAISEAALNDVSSSIIINP
jgi:hypothetical protein